MVEATPATRRSARLRSGQVEAAEAADGGPSSQNTGEAADGGAAEPATIPAPARNTAARATRMARTADAEAPQPVAAAEAALPVATAESSASEGSPFPNGVSAGGADYEADRSPSGFSDNEDSTSGGAAPAPADDLLQQLAAGMAAALGQKGRPDVAGGPGAGSAQRPMGSDGDEEGGASDMEDDTGSSSSSSQSSDEDSDGGGDGDRGGAAGAGNAHAMAPADFTAAEEAALEWVPESRLPPLTEGDEATDRLAAAARAGLQAQAQQLLAPPRDARRAAREAAKAAPDTAGRGWFDLPATQITPQVKQDLRLLALRGAFDPKRFYRAPDATKFPKYFQMGTVVEGPADFYSGRMTRKERKQTLTEELLADAQLQAAHKRRFNKLQAERSKFADKRKIAKRKTSNPRLNKRPQKPKH